jgi:hypothetical protein
MKAHEFKAAELRAEGPSLSPEFVRRVLEHKASLCPQDAQVEESMKALTREDLEDVIRDLRVRLRVSNERNLGLMAAIRRFNREVLP